MKKAHPFLRALSLLFVLPFCAAGQERLAFSNLSLESGLSQITVICIHQDSQGFMWFGTRNGLNRYDGYDFDIFLNDPRDPASLSDNHILALAEEPGGALWIGTNNGLNRYDPEKGGFTRYFSDPRDSCSLSHNMVQALTFDSGGSLWAGTRGGLNRYDPDSARFRRYELDGVLKGASVLALFSHRQKLYVGTESAGLIIYDTLTGEYEVAGREPGGAGSGLGYVRAILVDKDDNLWVGTRHSGISLRRPGEREFTVIGPACGLTNEYVRAIAQTPRGEILAGTFDGLNVIDPVTLRIEPYRTFGSSPGDLSHYSIYSIYVDRGQTVWVGSYAGGVDYYNRYGQKFAFYDLRHREQGIFGILGPVAETEDCLYVASEGSGIIEFEKATGAFRSYPVFREKRSSYARNIVKTLCLDGGRILCGTNLGTIYSFDLETKTYSLFHDTRTEDPIYYLGRNRRGELMVGGVNNPVGLLTVARNGRVTSRFPVTGRGNVCFPDVRCVLEITKDRYLIGTRNDGLLDYNRSSRSLVRYKHTPGHTDGIPENYVTSLLQDRAGNVWVGTFGGGLARFDPPSGRFTVYTTREGLPHNNVCNLQEDLYGHIWISTISGIADFDPQTGRFTGYSQNNGVKIDEFTVHAGTTLKNGHIVFCGSNGMVMFDPGFMYDNPFVPPVVLRNLYLNNDRIVPGDDSGILGKELNAQGKIVLHHNQSNFSIEFSALNYIYPERNRYSYILEGFDTGWNDVGSRRMAYYTNIPPGKYRFVVRGSNNDGIWNNDGRSLEITVLPPFWKTGWAYILYVLAGAGIGWLVLRYFDTRRRLENDIRLKQAEARAQAEFHEARDKLFTHFSHELRTPLTLIMSPLEDLIGEEAELPPGRLKETHQLILGNARRLLRLVNNLMDFQKKEHGKLRLRLTGGDFAAFSREMAAAFAVVAQARNITLNLETQPETLPHRFDQELMEKVFFNYLSNAFKNTPNGGTVWIRIRLLERDALPELLPERVVLPGASAPAYLFFEIGDSGQGIPEEELENIFIPFYQVAQNEHSASGTGLGLSLSKAIIEMHRGVIWAESPPGSGALFRTLLPLDPPGLPDGETGDGGPPLPRLAVDSEARQRFAGAEAEPPADGKKRHTVLVVEDHIEVRRYIASQLWTRYRILEAANGADALAKARNHLPDLVITDRMMPRMDGIQLVSLLKEDIRTSHIPVIMITAKAMPAEMKEGYRAGADDYIVKPFNASVLVERVANLIRSRETLKSLYGKRFSLEAMGVEAASVDERFMERLYALMEKNRMNVNFCVDDICREIGMSRTNLYRKIKAITDLSPNTFIRNFRLETGAKILAEAEIPVSEVYVTVGFSSHAYFSNCFKTLYGVSPSEYSARKAKEKKEGTSGEDS